jgi:hypothetical protein
MESSQAEQNHEIVATASCQHKQMPNSMGPWPMTVQGIEDHPHGVKESTRQQPVEAGGGLGGNDVVQGE